MHEAGRGDGGVWRLYVDTGGTFTDCVSVAPDGRQHRAKVLSNGTLRGTVAEVLAPDRLRVASGWSVPAGFARGLRLRPLGTGGDGLRILAHAAGDLLQLEGPVDGGLERGRTFELLSGEEAPVLAARLATGTPFGRALPPLEMRLATTRGTNALLERGGAPTVLFTTRGFADLLRIGTQQRPDIFALRVTRPEQLPARVVEVCGRVAADGAVLSPLDLEALRAGALRALEDGFRCAAVALVNAYVEPAHEREAGEMLLRLGFEHVSISTDLAREIRLLPRARTAVVDAYLRPIVGTYLRRVAGGLRSGDGGRHDENARPALLVMTSAGGLVTPDAYRPSNSLLSGPAGGVLGALEAGRRAGYPKVIAFDMGGTSTDVSRIDGEPEYRWEHQVGGEWLVAPALAIETVAAGGGSVCAFEREALTVGPRSAGAEPGPACYGAGGPLTLTDVNLLLGRLDAGGFGIPVDRAAAERAADALRERVETIRGGGTETDALLRGLLEIADERMAEAIRSISVREGYDPADYALVAFGGAGGQHACAVADRLGVRRIVVPPDASLLSAAGLREARLERFANRQLLLPVAEVEAVLASLDSELVAAATRELARLGVAGAQCGVRRRIATLRFTGQEATLAVDYEPGGRLEPLFRERYQEVFGHLPGEIPVEVESLRVVVADAAAGPATPDGPDSAEQGPPPSTRCMTGSGWQEIPVYRREALQPNNTLQTPALVRDTHTSVYVAEGWTARVDACSTLLLERLSPLPDDDGAVEQAPERRPAAVVEELFTSRFQAIARQMGEQLQRTAFSTNVRERLDFSCALLDRSGFLVASAPHIPVHLGALGLCVRSVVQALPLGPGDVAVTNHPAHGGSHLPDVTVISPVHAHNGERIGYVASRAHHAELGGSRPGSMPPDARTLEEEGVVIPPMLLVAAGEPRWPAIRHLLTSARFPSRDPESNMADLRAQLAANRLGAELLADLAAEHGLSTVDGQMAKLRARAARLMEAALGRRDSGTFRAEERLDDGSVLRATIRIDGAGATVDFGGTSGVHRGNLNATPAIVRSAVIYVLRLLVNEPIPLNEGLLQCVTLSIPEGMLNPHFPADPGRCPAVVGGNTEVSQRLVDTLLKALGLVACSQGTMNNVLWGDHSSGYYETVGGGAGAGPGWDGESGVHCHMTNTRITDVEVLERRHPVRLERFQLRRGSGGAGSNRGGDGLVREITFLAPLSLSVLAQHRVERPYGCEGGEAGLSGRQRVIRAGGEELLLRPSDGCEVGPGDRLILETPGGGGWGRSG